MEHEGDSDTNRYRYTENRGKNANNNAISIDLNWRLIVFNATACVGYMKIDEKANHKIIECRILTKNGTRL